MIRYLQLTFLFLLTMTFSGCQVIADIFQAGIWVGVIGVVLVLGVVFFILSRFKR
jgi:hypothetical protein